jgi:hypothetical protein
LFTSAITWFAICWVTYSTWVPPFIVLIPFTKLTLNQITGKLKHTSVVLVQGT